MNKKVEKLGNLIHEIITPIILNYTEEETQKFGIVSVIKITVSEDYSFADIYLSSQKNTTELPKFLSKHAGEFKKIIGRKISIRKVPSVRFKTLKNDDKNNNIYSLITKLSKQYGLDK